MPGWPRLETLRAQAGRAADLGITTQIHGIGDAAVRAALDVLAPTQSGAPRWCRRESSTRSSSPRRTCRASARSAWPPSMQPVHLRSDAAKARRLWGTRADADAFPFGALDRTGGLIAFGTDAPVEPVDPWTGLACAVTRSSPEWPEDMAPLGPQHALDLWRAIRASCLGPALTAAETDRGRLVPGHRADLVVVPAAAVAEPVETGGALWGARPRLVLLDGEVVFER